jgi:hypothetical protein
VPTAEIAASEAAVGRSGPDVGKAITQARCHAIAAALQ